MDRSQAARGAPALFSAAVLALAAAALGPAPPPADAQSAQFYGRSISWFKYFGQRTWKEHTAGQVTGAKVFSPGGVLVDRSRTPNAIYVPDMGNNRILGFRSYESSTPDLVIGQPNAASSAPNGDANLGRFAPPSRASLCLFDVPGNTNTTEQFCQMNFDVDAAGNLYVPDIYNHRVLVYLAPFSEDRTNGRGDRLPDRVLGQPDYASNGVNHGLGVGACDARSLDLANPGGRPAAGVSVDAAGNVWVADTYNHRVLRFPPGASNANLVLGQPGFTSRENNFHPNETLSADNQARRDRFGWPGIARVHPETGELYVLDQYYPDHNGPYSDSRILVFRPPFRSGMAAHRELQVRQPLEGDFTAGFRLWRCTGFTFNPVKTDWWTDESARTRRYRDGLLWLHGNNGNPTPDWGGRTLLVDREGNVLVALSAPDRTRMGGRQEYYGQAGMDILTPFNLSMGVGQIGFDSQHNIYLADATQHRISRYALPYRPRNDAAGLYLPPANGGLFPTPWSFSTNLNINNQTGARFTQDNYGMLVHGSSLIVRDAAGRLMVWNDYLSRPNGCAADVIVGQTRPDQSRRNHDLLGRSQLAADDRNRLWTRTDFGKLLVYALPLARGAQPLRTQIPLYWADRPSEEVSYSCAGALAFDAGNRRLWIFDRSHYRLLRVSNPDNWKGKLLVDAVLGQGTRTAGAINRGRTAPNASSFGQAVAIRFSPRGDLYVVDNDYEGHPNWRIVAYTAEDLAGISTLFPAVRARRLYCAARFDEVGFNYRPGDEYPFSPVAVAFNSRGEMVVGNDGYYLRPDRSQRPFRQLFLYRDPVSRTKPDAVIALPLGASADLCFDSQDNLVVQDHTYNRVGILNYVRDPGWLAPIGAPFEP